MIRSLFLFVCVWLCFLCSCTGRGASVVGSQETADLVVDSITSRAASVDSMALTAMNRIDSLVRDAKKKFWEREEARRDSLEQVQYNALPFISAEEAALWKPVLAAWLDFYGIDIRQMKQSRSSVLDFYSEPHKGSMYDLPFDPECDSNSLPIMQYSPDRQRYVNPALDWALGKDGNYYFMYDSESIQVYLTDRLAKIRSMILWGGASVNLDAVFWRNNDVFTLVGFWHPNDYYMMVFDLKNNTEDWYRVSLETDENKRSYLTEVFFKEEGIIEGSLEDDDIEIPMW